MICSALLMPRIWGRGLGVQTEGGGGILIAPEAIDRDKNEKQGTSRRVAKPVLSRIANNGHQYRQGSSGDNQMRDAAETRQS
jgi:hypothetical protein